MPSEEQLILAVAMSACALLAVGIIRLIRPSGRRPAVAPSGNATEAAVAPARAESAGRMIRSGAVAAPTVERHAQVPVGLRVGNRYRVVARLGTGALGTVCRAEDVESGHALAMRFLPRELAETLPAVHLLQHGSQAIVAASTAHEGFVRVTEFGETEAGRVFVAMELVEGRRLSEILSAGAPLEIGGALRLALDLGRSLETLHNLGIVHGAIRPRNVMVLGDGRVKLMDVELAALREALAREAHVAAKPPADHASPEQIRHEPLSEKSDVYAFGVVVYEMLGGAPPFRAATREAVLVKHLTETPDPLRRRRRAVPVAIERVVQQALAKRPADRPGVQDLVALLKAGASEARDEGARAPRRFRWLAGRPTVRGDAVPALIGDCVRLRERLAARERDRERLARTLTGVSRELAALDGELARLRGERVAMVRALGEVAHLLERLERLGEIARRWRSPV